MNTKKFLKENPDAHTAYIGWKISKGEIVVDDFGKPVKAIVFAVEKKKPLEELVKPIPKAYGSMVTDVVELPRMRATPPFPKKNTTDLQHRIRPISGGISIGHEDVTAGTLGVIVKDSILTENPKPQPFWRRFLIWLGNLFGFDANVYSINVVDIPLIMSNNHVLANENLGEIGDPILQPGAYDGGENPKDVVGYLHDFTPISFDKPNYMDVAFASIDANTPYEFGVIDIPVMTDVVKSVQLDQLVQKTGRTTGYTYGKVIGIDVSSQVEYSEGVALFEDQIMIWGMNGSFSQGGDSGSLILDYDGNPVGLLFAGGGSITLANKMSRIVEEYGIRFE